MNKPQTLTKPGQESCSNSPRAALQEGNRVVDGMGDCLVVVRGFRFHGGKDQTDQKMETTIGCMVLGKGGMENNMETAVGCKV